jgi:hypothetical protein
MSISETKDGIILTVFVKPNSPEFKIELDGNEIIVYSTEEPEKGKVNKEIIKELSRFFKHRVEMVSGFTSKQKQLIVTGMDKIQVEAILKSLIGKT